MKNGEPKILNFLISSPFSIFRSQLFCRFGEFGVVNRHV
jgi:hypothetical protein